jgi:hypothetical protein
MKGNLVPSTELLDKTRDVAVFLHFFSSQRAASLEEEGLLRPYLGGQLRSFIVHLNIQVSCREFPNMHAAKHELIYAVADNGVVKLEFTDSQSDTATEVSRDLVSLHTYQSGEWEQRLDVAYQKCLDLRSQWNEVCTLMEQTTPDRPDEIVKLIEATDNPTQIIRLLVHALSTKSENMCESLLFAFVSVGKVKEAQLVLETLVQMYPEEAIHRIALGNMFFGALYNLKRPSGDPINRLRFLINADPKVWAPMVETLKQVDSALYGAITDKEREPASEPRWFKQISLEALGCSYEFARKTAEEHFIKAMQLSGDMEIREQAKQALVTLRMMDEMQ